MYYKYYTLFFTQSNWLSMRPLTDGCLCHLPFGKAAKCVYIHHLFPSLTQSDLSAAQNHLIWATEVTSGHTHNWSKLHCNPVPHPQCRAMQPCWSLFHWGKCFSWARRHTFSAQPPPLLPFPLSLSLSVHFISKLISAALPWLLNKQANPGSFIVLLSLNDVHYQAGGSLWRLQGGEVDEKMRKGGWWV